MSTVSLSVPGAHCGTCRADILRCVRGVPGVARAELDLERRELTVELDPTRVTVADLRRHLSVAGYPVGGGTTDPTPTRSTP